MSHVGPGQSCDGGPGGKPPRSSKDLVLWNHLLLIKLYLPQPVMELIQSLFSKIVGFFSLWKPCIFTNYLLLYILLKIYWTKKLFWALRLGTQTGIPPSGYITDIRDLSNELRILGRQLSTTIFTLLAFIYKNATFNFPSKVAYC